jgi:Helix-turn-helix domain
MTTTTYNAAPAPPLLTTAEAAAFMRTPEGTLRYWRAVGKGPAYIKLPKQVVYQQADVESFVSSNIVVPSVRTEARKEAQRVAH